MQNRRTVVQAKITHTSLLDLFPSKETERMQAVVHRREDDRLAHCDGSLHQHVPGQSVGRAQCSARVICYYVRSDSE